MPSVEPSANAHRGGLVYMGLARRYHSHLDPAVNGAVVEQAGG